MAAKDKAHTAVNKAIKRGDLKPPYDFTCRHCYHEQATVYHHHNGYGRKHRLDVIPVCGRCHYALHAHENKRHKLSDSDVRTARQMKQEGKSTKEIARYFDYDPSNMTAVLKGTAYYWVK